MTNPHERIHDLCGRNGLRPVEVIQIGALDDPLLSEVGQVRLRHIGCEEGKESVSAVWSVMTRQVAKEKSGESRSEGTIVRVASTILEAPCREVCR